VAGAPNSGAEEKAGHSGWDDSPAVSIKSSEQVP